MWYFRWPFWRRGARCPRSSAWERAIQLPAILMFSTDCLAQTQHTRGKSTRPGWTTFHLFNLGKVVLLSFWRVQDDEICHAMVDLHESCSITPFNLFVCIKYQPTFWAKESLAVYSVARFPTSLFNCMSLSSLKSHNRSTCMGDTGFCLFPKHERLKSNLPPLCSLDRLPIIANSFAKRRWLGRPAWQVPHPPGSRVAQCVLL